jgi:hypothetical protein
MLTSSTLIESVKNRALIPTNQQTFTTADFLRFANEEMLIGMVPNVLQTHEEHMLFQEAFAINPNVSAYEIPYRAIANKLRDVYVLDSSGNLINMTRINKDDLGDYPSYYGNGFARGFYVLSNTINLMPLNSPGNTGDDLLMTYYMRPNNMVAEERVATIQSVSYNSGTQEYTLTFTAASPTAFTAQEKYDIVQGYSPYKILQYDITPSAVTSSTIVIPRNQLEDAQRNPDNSIRYRVPKAGDFVSLAGETKVPQLTDELHSVLAQRIACRCLEALGDREGLNAANAKLAEMLVNTNILLQNRVEGSPQKVVNTQSPLRSRRYTFRP